MPDASFDLGGMPPLDLSGIDKQYDPQIAESRTAAQAAESSAVTAAGAEADVAEQYAGEETAQSEQLQQWMNTTPTRQAAYAGAMHAAPVLAIMTALGGRITKLNGQAMLGATNGIVSGINAGAESQYEDAYKAWQAGYAKIKEHQDQLARAHRLMLTAYAGRADAYQKAAEAARRMTGDLLDEKQTKATETINAWKAQATATAQLKRIDQMMAMNHARLQHMLKQESRWDALTKAAGSDPQMKQQIAVAREKAKNIEQNINTILKQKQQLISNIEIPEAVKGPQLNDMDDHIEALEAQKDSVIADMEAVAARGPAPPKPPAPTVGSPPDKQRGAIDRSGKPQAQVFGEASQAAAGRTSPVSGSTPQPPPGVPSTNAQGWPIRYDPQSNSWGYVGPKGPDGKYQFEEVGQQ